MFEAIRNFFTPKPQKIIVSAEVIEKRIKKFQKSLPNRLKKAKNQLGDKYIMSPTNQVKRLSKQMQRKMNLA